jgi:hypothetical protein
MNTARQSEEVKLSRVNAQKSGSEIISVRVKPETQERVSMLMVGIVIAAAVILAFLLLLYIIFVSI